MYILLNEENLGKETNIVSDWRRPSSTPERLKIALSQAKMKQIDLSNLTGIDKGSISNYLSGRYEPKSDAINKMAVALNVSEMWLWGYDVPMEREEKGSSDDNNLTEGKRLMLELLDEIPEEEQILLAKSIRAFRQIPAEHQKMLNQIIRAALNNQI